STAVRTTSSFSSGDSEEFSPSVPSMTKPSQPAARQDSMCRAVASRSSAPSFFISVIRAGITPCQWIVILQVLSVGRSGAQVGLDDVGIGTQLRCFALHADAAALQHIAVIGQFQGETGILFDQKDGGAGVVEPFDDAHGLEHQ